MLATVTASFVSTCTHSHSIRITQSQQALLIQMNLSLKLNENRNTYSVDEIYDNRELLVRQLQVLHHAMPLSLRRRALFRALLLLLVLVFFHSPSKIDYPNQIMPLLVIAYITLIKEIDN